MAAREQISEPKYVTAEAGDVVRVEYVWRVRRDPLWLETLRRARPDGVLLRVESTDSDLYIEARGSEMAEAFDAFDHLLDEIDARSQAELDQRKASLSAATEAIKQRYGVDLR